MSSLLLVGLGGFVGAILRYTVSGALQRHGGTFPLGTLGVNVIGCLAIGVLMGLAQYRQLLAPELRLFLTLGLLGSFTTFSTFGYETFAMLRDSNYFVALSNVAANVVIGFVAVVVGWTLGKGFGN
ncbi:MAG: fluoride efflux transporter CrcB [Candidatus Latescibacterota bacterium]|nr:MAG: fluoride efflux transporter CrcB [Candidatus Latescibacterota bacterium]